MTGTPFDHRPPLGAEERWAPGLWMLAIALALIAYEVLAYSAAVWGQTTALGPFLALAPLLIIALWLLLRAGRTAGVALVLCAGAAILALCYVLPNPTLLYLVPHVLPYMLLLWMFARTLRPGREALITRVARRVHGTLPAQIELYTRRVTWGWSIFFAAMVATSVLLFVFAPLRVWSLFANVLNLPLILLIFVGEYVYRVLRYPTFSHVSLLTTARAFRRFGRPAASDGR